MVYMYIKNSMQSDKIEHFIQSYTKGYTSFWRLSVEAEIQKKKKISKIYSLTKDCKFWAGMLLRNVAYLLSFKAPGYRLAITHR